MELPVRGTRLVASAAWAMTLVVAGCDQYKGPADESGSTGGELVLEPRTIIGETEGDPAYLFGDIRSIAVDDAGRVYVGDRIGATVRVYSAEGLFLEEVTREGQGPGEIDGWPADLSFGPDGALFVRDASGVTKFVSREPGGIPDSLAGQWRVPGYGNLTSARSHVGADGTYYYPNGTYRPGEPPRFFYEVSREGSLSSDTVAVPYYEGMEAQRPAFYRIGAGGGRMVDGLSHGPFAPVPSWDVTDRGTVLSASGSSGHLLETDAALDTVRVIELKDTERRRVPPDERADSMRALEARIDSLPVRIEKVVNLGAGVAERRTPEFLPDVISVSVAPDGLIWIGRWPDEGSGGSRFYDVYDSTGAVRASVKLEAPLVSEPQPFFGRNTVVGVVVDPETDVQRVVTFSVSGLGVQE